MVKFFLAIFNKEILYLKIRSIPSILKTEEELAI
jgi:hypothetical protein